MKKIIYTTLFGAYDKLKEPAVINKDWQHICFTDLDIESKTWDIVKIKDYDVSAVKMSKKIKILWYKYIEAELSIYIDASLTINCNLDKFVKKYHKRGFTVMNHPARNCIYKEAEIVIREKIDKAEIVNEQMKKYRAEGFPENYGLTANGVMIRDKYINTLFFDKWWNEVEQHSKRDQLSFMYVWWRVNIATNRIPYEVIFNEFKFTHHGK